MIVFTSKREVIQLVENPFASGGEGAVYKVISSPKYSHEVCVKIYHAHVLNKEREERIKYMVLNPPQKIRDEGFLLGWPMDWVTDEDGKFLGFVMPMGFPDSKELVTLTATSVSKKLSSEWHDRYDRSLGKPALVARLKLICNIAIPVHILHSTGKYVLKDFKPQNVLVTSDGRITMVDMDSIQIVDSQKLLFAGTAATPEYMPPEYYTKGTGRKADDIISPSWDSFAIGVVFYQLLFGIHPYVVTPKTDQGDGANDISHNISSGLFPFGIKGDDVKIRPKLHDNFMVLPDKLQELFMRTFSDESEKRPAAEEWGRYIHAEVIRADVKALESQKDNKDNNQINKKEGQMTKQESSDSKSSPLLTVDNIIFAYISFFLLLLFPGIIKLFSRSSSVFLEDSFIVVPYISSILSIIWGFSKRGEKKVPVIMWTVAIVWMAIYYIMINLFNTHDYWPDFGRTIVPLTIIVAIVLIVLVIYKIIQNNRREDIAFYIGALSAIMFILLCNDLLFWYTLPSIVVVILIVCAVKGWKKLSVFRGTQVLSVLMIGALHNNFFISSVNIVIVMIVIALLLLFGFVYSKNFDKKSPLFFIGALLLTMVFIVLKYEFIAQECYGEDYDYYPLFESEFLPISFSGSFLFLMFHVCSYFLLYSEADKKEESSLLSNKNEQ